MGGVQWFRPGESRMGTTDCRVELMEGEAAKRN